MFSGDKLLGGPQAGIILGDKDLIAELRRQPLTRALRVDKATLAALQATLLAYLRGTALTEIPVWQMIVATPAALEARALSWAAVLRSGGLLVETRPGQSAVGGGSLPGQTLPTTLLALRPPQPDRLVSCLRHGDPPVIARIEDDTVLLDPRTVLPAQDEPLIAALVAAWKDG
jgi:L-seryl-tRNA(Ser) seleniumtransferase